MDKNLQSIIMINKIEVFKYHVHEWRGLKGLIVRFPISQIAPQMGPNPHIGGPLWGTQFGTPDLIEIMPKPHF
jgi:hypothetical protein